MKNFSLICLLLCVISSAYAQTEQSPEVEALIDKTLKNMIFVKGGSYMMGDPRQPFAAALGKDAFTQYFTSEDNVPLHKVTLDSYYMEAYEVTYENYDIYSNATKTPLAGADIREISYIYAPQRPVGISWNGARDYCQWLGKRTGLPFALPTEAQWEYAARNRGEIVVFATNNGKIERGKNYPPAIRYPMEVGQFPANPLGIFDLSGNAYEWVSDWYQKDYYSHSPENNPQGPETGKRKVARGGGAIVGPPDSTTVARRDSTHLGKGYSSDGFRCVINTDKPLPVQ